MIREHIMNRFDHSLVADVPVGDRLLSREACETLWERVQKLARGGGRTAILLTSHWNGELRWARNQVHLASDRRNVRLKVERVFGWERGTATVNQLDDASLEAAVRMCEIEAHRKERRVQLDMPLLPPPQAMPSPLIWSDTTYGATAAMRGKLAQTLSEGAASEGLVSAGYLEVRGATIARVGGGEVGWANSSYGLSWREEQYSPAMDQTLFYHQMTQAQCSMTVRHPKGVGSGWAGLSSFDWRQIDTAALADRALKKCVASLNPVRIEPGRYTVILEPQAVHGLVRVMMDSHGLSRMRAEQGDGPWVLDRDPSLGVWRTKLGLKVVDERITLSHDPMDPMLGEVPQPGLAPITYIEHGVLKTLYYPQHFSAEQLKEEQAAINRGGVRMSGGTTSIEEMIATTKRGLIVTRFSGLTFLDYDIPLATGVTRDGLWLVENGKITKAVQNMRLTESPLFVFNRIEQLGVPVPVFRPKRIWDEVGLNASIIPPIKAHDFSFTSTIDAI